MVGGGRVRRKESEGEGWGMGKEVGESRERREGKEGRSGEGEVRGVWGGFFFFKQRTAYEIWL